MKSIFDQSRIRIFYECNLPFIERNWVKNRWEGVTSLDCLHFEIFIIVSLWSSALLIMFGILLSSTSTLPVSIQCWMSCVEFFPWSATSSISRSYCSRAWIWSYWSLILESFASSSACRASASASSTHIKVFVRFLLLPGLRIWTPRPLVAKNHQFRSKITHFLMMLLTADIGRFMECSGNWWVKLDD